MHGRRDEYGSAGGPKVTEWGQTQGAGCTMHVVRPRTAVVQGPYQQQRQRQGRCMLRTLLASSNQSTLLATWPAYERALVVGKSWPGVAGSVGEGVGAW